MNKDINDFCVSLGLEVGECYYQKYDDRAQLTIELKGKITVRQIRKIEAQTGMSFENIKLMYNELEGSSCVDLLFIR